MIAYGNIKQGMEKPHLSLQPHLSKLLILMPHPPSPLSWCRALGPKAAAMTAPGKCPDGNGVHCCQLVSVLAVSVHALKERPWSTKSNFSCIVFGLLCLLGLWPVSAMSKPSCNLHSVHIHDTNWQLLYRAYFSQKTLWSSSSCIKAWLLLIPTKTGPHIFENILHLHTSHTVYCYSLLDSGTLGLPTLGSESETCRISADGGFPACLLIVAAVALLMPHDAT